MTNILSRRPDIKGVITARTGIVTSPQMGKPATAAPSTPTTPGQPDREGGSKV